MSSGSGRHCMLYCRTLLLGLLLELSSCTQLLGQQAEGDGLVIPGSGYARFHGEIACRV